MPPGQGVLHFICGRLASGKTTLAWQLAKEKRAILFCEDEWLTRLSDGITSFADYLKWSQRCRSMMGPLATEILRTGVSVVFDFGGNTLRDRAWVRSVFEAAGAQHALHLLETSEDTCLERPRERNRTKPDGLYFATTSDEDFFAICRYYQEPTESEHFTVVQHGAF